MNHPSRHLLAALALLAACPSPSARAQGDAHDIPLRSPGETARVEKQTADLFALLAKPIHEASRSTVWIHQGNSRPALGTVVGDGTQIVTKWSELLVSRGSLRIVTGNKESHPAKIQGVYEKDDIAVLKLQDSAKLPAITWSGNPEPPAGAFLIGVLPDDEPAGFGVVSVAGRVLRDTEQAYLGILADPRFNENSARIANVENGSGAKAAGLRPGDLIVSIGDRKITGAMEMRNALIGRKPGDSVRVSYLRDGKPASVEVKLGHRPELAQFSGQRMEMMERLGGNVSRIRNGFSRVIQTDMPVDPNHAGAPVTDLQGRPIGLLVARADRTRSFILPAATLTNLLKSPASDPDTAARSLVARQAAPHPRLGMLPPGFGDQDADPGLPQMDERSAARIREHLKQMRRMMQQMQEEMDQLDDR